MDINFVAESNGWTTIFASRWKSPFLRAIWFYGVKLTLAIINSPIERYRGRSVTGAVKQRKNPFIRACVSDSVQRAIADINRSILTNSRRTADWIAHGA